MWNRNPFLNLETSRRSRWRNVRDVRCQRITAMRPKTKENFRAAAMLLFYMLQKCYLTKITDFLRVFRHTRFQISEQVSPVSPPPQKFAYPSCYDWLWLGCLAVHEWSYQLCVSVSCYLQLLLFRKCSSCYFVPQIRYPRALNFYSSGFPLRFFDSLSTSQRRRHLQAFGLSNWCLGGVRSPGIYRGGTEFDSRR